MGPTSRCRTCGNIFLLAAIWFHRKNLAHAASTRFDEPDLSLFHNRTVVLTDDERTYISPFKTKDTTLSFSIQSERIDEMSEKETTVETDLPPEIIDEQATLDNDVLNQTEERNHEKVPVEEEALSDDLDENMEGLAVEPDDDSERTVTEAKLMEPHVASDALSQVDEVKRSQGEKEARTSDHSAVEGDSDASKNDEASNDTEPISSTAWAEIDEKVAKEDTADEISEDENFDDVSNNDESVDARASIDNVPEEDRRKDDEIDPAEPQESGESWTADTSEDSDESVLNGDPHQSSDVNRSEHLDKAEPDDDNSVIDFDDVDKEKRDYPNIKAPLQETEGKQAAETDSVPEEESETQAQSQDNRPAEDMDAGRPSFGDFLSEKGSGNDFHQRATQQGIMMEYEKLLHNSPMANMMNRERKLEGSTDSVGAAGDRKGHIEIHTVPHKDLIRAATSDEKISGGWGVQRKGEKGSNTPEMSIQGQRTLPTYEDREAPNTSESEDGFISQRSSVTDVGIEDAPDGQADNIEDVAAVDNGEESIDPEPRNENGDAQAASTGAAKSVNTEFVEGLDDIDKFMEEVDPPDELDVGAAGSSIQEVLVGQGAHILKRRVNMCIRHVRKNVAKIRAHAKARLSKISKRLKDEEGKFAVAAISQQWMGRTAGNLGKVCRRGFRRLHEFFDELLSVDDDDFDEMFGEEAAKIASLHEMMNRSPKRQQNQPMNYPGLQGMDKLFEASKSEMADAAQRLQQGVAS